MKLKLLSSMALGALVWVALLSPVVRETPSASAAPGGLVEPTAGSITQTFTFSFGGFQPYTQLTLSVLQPGATQFTILPVPVVTNGQGQAQFSIGLLDLVDAGALPFALPGVPITVSWGAAPTSPYYIRADACDTVDCVEFIGSFGI